MKPFAVALGIAILVSGCFAHHVHPQTAPLPTYVLPSSAVGQFCVERASLVGMTADAALFPRYACVSVEDVRRWIRSQQFAE